MSIVFKIPYEELIEKNGLGPCLEIVPGTRRYITHKKTYGKENAYGKDKKKDL